MQSTSPNGQRTFGQTAGLALAVASGLVLTACGGRGPKPPAVVDQDLSQIGTQNTKPDGGAYIVDPHGAGQKSGVRISEMYWGRLVNIVDGNGDTIYRDFVVDANFVGAAISGEGTLQTADAGGTPLTYVYDQNAITGIETIEISAVDDPNDGADPFDLAVQELSESASQIAFAGEDDLGLLTRVPRNCAIVVRFDDLMARSSFVLNDTVKILTGNPPTQTFDARLLMDANHGGVDPNSGQFVSTRMIIDTTVGAFEAVDEAINGTIPLNNLGLPEAKTDLQANITLLFPTIADPQSGQFQRLTNLSGKPLFSATNGPVSSLPTQDLVRAMRTTTATEEGDAFLRDTKRPEIVGSQNVEVANMIEVTPVAVDDPTFELTVDLEFALTACAEEPEAEDVVQFTNDVFGNVIEDNADDVSDGIAGGTRVSIPNNGWIPQSIIDAEAATPGALSDYIETQVLGTGVFRHRFDGLVDSDNPTQPTPGSELDTGKAACFATFSPTAAAPPSAQVPNDAQVTLRFSEPMDPSTFGAFDSFRVTRRPVTETLNAYDYVVGTIAFAPDLREFRFQPLLPFSNEDQSPGGTTDADNAEYHLSVVSSIDGGLRDLNGNPLLNVTDDVDFTVVTNAVVSVNTGGYVMRFEDDILDETGNGNADIRGQFVHDQTNGRLLPRGVTRFSRVIDLTIPAVAAMNIPQVPGVQTPLSNLGSRLHALWRYEDMGLTISPVEGTFTDIDVEFSYLNPVGGQITAAFYPEFMLGFAHGCCHPDEALDNNPTFSSGFPKLPTSGFKNNSNYADTYLNVNGATPDVLHEKPLGFEVANSELFTSETETPLLRMPLNRGLAQGERETFTWRDTSITTRGALAPNGNTQGDGVPTLQEAFYLGFPACEGSVWGGGNDKGVPTAGLPVLLEYRCYPTETLALINFGISISSGSSRNPFHRAFSTGGYNTQGSAVPKNPDAETSPSGGFQGNPLAAQPLGTPTPGLDNTVYYGQLDFVVRLSRAHTVPIDANGNPDPTYRGIAIEPSITQQPTGTEVQVSFRGHDTVILGTTRILDAANLSVYGDDFGPNGFTDGVPTDFNGCGSTGYTSFEFDAPNWQDTIQSQNGRQYVQYRFTFVNNVVSELAPVLDSFGVAYDF